MPVDTIVASAPLVSASADSVLPRCLAFTPEHVRRADGSYGFHGLRTGSRVRCSSVIELALCLQMESCAGFRSIARPSELYDDDGADWNIDLRRVADAGLRPTFFVLTEVGGREMPQALTIVSEEDARRFGGDARSAMRQAYHECGLPWNVMTEGWVNWSRAATLLFFAECRWMQFGSHVEAGVRHAIATSLPEDSLADVLIEASLEAGVQPGVAMRAYGLLVAKGLAPGDVSGRPVRTDRPLGAAITPQDDVEDTIAIADVWRAALAQEHHSCPLA